MLKDRKVRRTRKFVGAIGVLVTVASLSGCVTDRVKSDNTNKEVTKIEATQEPIATPEVTPAPTETPEERAEREAREFLDSLPIEKRSAIEMAQSYLSTMPFSPSGLYDQLLFEGFSEEDSQFAIDHLIVDWDEMCYETAVSYITNVGGFSKKSLIHQLEYDGFTKKQAKKAVKRLGYK